MKRKIEWDANISSEEQDMNWRLEFLKWDFSKKLDYLFKLYRLVNKKSEKGERRIEWTSITSSTQKY